MDESELSLKNLTDLQGLSSPHYFISINEKVL